MPTGHHMGGSTLWTLLLMNKIIGHSRPRVGQPLLVQRRSLPPPPLVLRLSRASTKWQSGLQFSKLLVINGVLPADWDWLAFGMCAESLIGYAFEGSDALQKYGSEHAPDAAQVSMSTAMLRSTAHVIYGDHKDSAWHETSREYDAVGNSVRQWSAYGRRGDRICAEVGGHTAWRRLYQNFRLPGARGSV